MEMHKSFEGATYHNGLGIEVVIYLSTERWSIPINGGFFWVISWFRFFASGESSRGVALGPSFIKRPIGLTCTGLACLIRVTR